MANTARYTAKIYFHERNLVEGNWMDVCFYIPANYYNDKPMKQYDYLKKQVFKIGHKEKNVEFKNRPIYNREGARHEGKLSFKCGVIFDNFHNKPIFTYTWQEAKTEMEKTKEKPKFNLQDKWKLFLQFTGQLLSQEELEKYFIQQLKPISYQNGTLCFLARSRDLLEEMEDRYLLNFKYGLIHAFGTQPTVQYKLQVQEEEPKPEVASKPVAQLTNLIADKMLVS